MMASSFTAASDSSSQGRPLGNDTEEQGKQNTENVCKAIEEVNELQHTISGLLMEVEEAIQTKIEKVYAEFDQS